MDILILKSDERATGAWGDHEGQESSARRCLMTMTGHDVTGGTSYVGAGKLERQSTLDALSEQSLILLTHSS